MSEIGGAENISKSYASRILRLAFLAQDIVETILEGFEGSDTGIRLGLIENDRHQGRGIHRDGSGRPSLP